MVESSYSSSDKSGLIQYFKELELDKYCISPILDGTMFKTFEGVNDVAPCLCTVIYYTTKEIMQSSLNSSHLALAKNQTVQFNGPVVYEVWKNTTKKSTYLELLMNPLNNISKWNKVCLTVEKTLSPFCKFLNVEVLMLNMDLQKPNESINDNIVQPSKNIISENPSDITKESKTSEVISEINTLEPNNNELVANDDQKTKKQENIITDNTESASKKDLFINNEKELGQEKIPDDIDTPMPNEDSDSNDYPKENDGIINKEDISDDHLIFNTKNKFTNHRFGDEEDTHFLFYFGIMTVLSMMFYLALYNKKKKSLHF
jgi:hypothetical protein